MATAVCGVQFGVCRARITKVDSAGNVVAGDNSYVTDAIQEVTLNPNIETGNNVVVRNGCGCKIASKKFPDTFNFWELSFTNGQLEPAAVNLLLGAGSIDDGGTIVGTAYPSTLACDEDPPFVAFEWWSINQVGSGQDGTYPWIHFVIPKVKWIQGNVTFGEQNSPDVFNGTSETNTQWGDGPYGDGPPDGQDISEGGKWFTDVDPPAADCATASVTAVS
jgi:hypothetical protein